MNFSNMDDVIYFNQSNETVLNNNITRIETVKRKVFTPADKDDYNDLTIINVCDYIAYIFVNDTFTVTNNILYNMDSYLNRNFGEITEIEIVGQKMIGKIGRNDSYILLAEKVVYTDHLKNEIVVTIKKE